jgi:hypothetical protein
MRPKISVIPTGDASHCSAPVHAGRSPPDREASSVRQVLAGPRCATKTMLASSTYTLQNRILPASVRQSSTPKDPHRGMGRRLEILEPKHVLDHRHPGG